MKMFKILSLVAVFLLASIKHDAAILATNVPAGKTLLLSGFSKINQITVQNTTTNTFSGFRIYDAPATSTTWTNAAYTNRTLIGPVDVTTIYTNFFNELNTNIISMVYYTNVAVAASTPSYRLTAIAALPPTPSVITITPSSGQFYNLGVLLSNTVEVNITVDYNK